MSAVPIERSSSGEKDDFSDILALMNCGQAGPLRRFDFMLVPMSGGRPLPRNIEKDGKQTRTMFVVETGVSYRLEGSIKKDNLCLPADEESIVVFEDAKRVVLIERP
ncbi:MAG: hypothetical protein CMP20_02700 [Rickettsiales bacterium]|nr:hypothetical protein [Rickettsiales bacterium]